MGTHHASRRIRAGVGILALLAVGSAGACDGEPPSQPVPTTTIFASPTGDAEPGPATPVGFPATGCQVTSLRTSTGGGGVVNGGDPSGHYLVGEAGQEAAIWHDGVATYTPYGDKASLSDINTSGDAVGWIVTGDYGAMRAAAYIDGTWHELRGDNARAAAINEHGLIAGAIWMYTDVQWPVVWPSLTAEPQQLPLPPGSHEGMVADIRDDGTVAGGVLIPRVGIRPVVWQPDGTLRDLTGLLPTAGPNGEALWDAYPQDMRGDWMLIYANFPNRRNGYLVLNLATSATRWLPAGFTAAAINARGWVVGSDEHGAALIDKGDTTVRLPVPMLYVTVTTISDDGRTIGGHLPSEPFLWRCA